MDRLFRSEGVPDKFLTLLTVTLPKELVWLELKGRKLDTSRMMVLTIAFVALIRGWEAKVKRGGRPFGVLRPYHHHHHRREERKTLLIFPLIHFTHD